MYYELQIGGITYKLRLTTKNSVALEKALGYNPIMLLMDIDSGKMPKLGDMILVLHYMLQSLEHGITLEKTYDLYDRFIADGNGMFDLLPVFVEVFQNSGYLTTSANKEEEVKN